MGRLFIRYCQSARSDRIRMIAFNHEQHHVIEKSIEKRLARSTKKYIADDNKMKLLDICAQLKNDTIGDLYLSSPAQLQCVIENLGVDHFERIILVKHEGDFPITGNKPSCDCIHCVLNFILGLNQHGYQPIFESQTIYCKGIQYSYVVYEKHDKPLLAQKNACKIKKNKLKLPKKNQLANESHIISSWEIYHALGAPKFICAPMVGLSERAFRLLVRRYNAELCYTPMILSDLFCDDEKYRAEMLTASEEDRPLVAQFAANDPNVLVQAANYAAPHCDAIDINLGCPQPIARRNQYGSWLMENWHLISTMIQALKEACSLPVFAKIRVFDEDSLTLEYAQMLENAGVNLLAVHARTRANHMNDKPANWEIIKQIKDMLSIPVFANGNIHCFNDVEECLHSTKADGVLSADALLSDPTLYQPDALFCPRRITQEYLSLALQDNTPIEFAKPHVLQFLARFLSSDDQLRLKQCQTVNELVALTSSDELELRENTDVAQNNYAILEKSFEENTKPK